MTKTNDSPDFASDWERQTSNATEALRASLGREPTLSEIEVEICRQFADHAGKSASFASWNL